MAYETLNVQKEEGILLLSVAEPCEKPDHLLRLADELYDLCSEAAWDARTRVIVLAGEGKDSFSLGCDGTGPSSRGGEDDEAAGRSIAEPLAGIDLPVIAAIPGDAIGRGLELVMACDIRVAVEGARLGLPQVEAGLIPRDGGTQRLPRLVGRQKALEMILTGRTIGAAEAYRVGLVNRVVPSAELMPTVMQMAREMASKGPIALACAKEAVYQGMDLTLEQGLRLEADLYLLLHTTKDRTEGINAFLEKRRPRFEGE